MSDYVPFGVISFILVMVMAGVFFFYPAKTSDPVKPKPQVQTNIIKEQGK
jgi:hypothetical protein